jgi:hypothetical protein
MSGKSFLSVVVMTWCVTASGSVIRAEGSVIETRDLWCEEQPVIAETPVRLGLPATATVDARTGLAISMEEREAGAVTVRATGHGLDVLKSVKGDGEFTLSIRANGDAFAVAGTATAIVISRGAESVRIDTARPEPGAYGKAAALLSGSPALRLFRSAVSRLGPETRETPGGLALELGDVLLRIVQDDPGAVDRFREARTPEGRGAYRVALLSRRCYADWEAEALAAWGSYESCYNDFSWWSGGREVCAMMYLLRVEGAWFEYLTCVGFPTK